MKPEHNGFPCLEIKFVVVVVVVVMMMMMVMAAAEFAAVKMKVYS